MCGIVGYITQEKVRGQNDRRKFIDQALIAGTVRGDDSTGVFSVTHDLPRGESADWLKNVGDGYSFVVSKEYQERYGLQAKTDNYRCIIGHGRSATVGTVTTENAHPFQEGPITLVHNGTLDTTWHMGKSMADLKEEGVQVDSHVIAHNLAATEDAASVISKLDGAYALIWHDARDESINIVRNDRRPLHMLFATCEDTILIASEAEMLYWLAKRNTFMIGKVVTPKANELLKFTPGSSVPEVTVVPFYQAPRTTHSAWMARTAGSTSGGAAGTSPPPWKDKQSWPKVPADMELALMEHDLDADMELRFDLTRIQQVLGRTHAVVSGLAYHPEGDPINGVIHGLDYNAICDALDKEETWTVRPVGVQYLESDTPLLILKLVSRAYIPGKATPPRPAVIPRLAGRGTHEYVPGPGGEWIPVHEWLHCTADGCCQCGGDINADEAEEIQWVNNYSQPMCVGCIEENKVLARHDFTD
jgi:predicted glutamine amidotransferase